MCLSFAKKTCGNVLLTDETETFCKASVLLLLIENELEYFFKKTIISKLECDEGAVMIWGCFTASVDEFL